MWLRISGVPLAAETGISLIILPLAGGPLLRVATIRRTTDTHYRHIPLHFSHNERTPVQISLQYLHWFRIIKEMPGSVASGTRCISEPLLVCVGCTVRK